MEAAPSLGWTGAFTASFDSTCVLLFNPGDNTSDTTLYAGLPAGSLKWSFGALAPSGVIYGLTLYANGLLRIDPVAHYVSVPPLSIPAVGTYR